MEFELDGVKYETKPEPAGEGTHCCQGCAGDVSQNMCRDLREAAAPVRCNVASVIFVRKQDPAEEERLALRKAGWTLMSDGAFPQHSTRMIEFLSNDALLEDGETCIQHACNVPPIDVKAWRYYELKASAPAATHDKPTNPKDAIATFKLPLHLVSPIVKAYQALAHYLGNVKYGAWNWRPAGVRASVYRSALERHVDAWWEGEKYDPTDGTPHLANAQACLNILIEAEETGVLTDDRPPSRKEHLARVRKELEAVMPQIAERYKDKSPRHYTIADTEISA